MSSGEKIPLEEAKGLAMELIQNFGHLCEQIEVAGSIRRRIETVGDIELVCRPRLVELAEYDLFGDRIGTTMCNTLDTHLSDLLSLGGAFAHRLDRNGRRAFGPRAKRLTFRGVALDWFSAIEPAQYGLVLAIRTGPREFSHRLVTLVAQGGWMPAGMRCHNGALWRDGVLLETQNEHDVFEALGRPYIAPENRR